MTEAVLKTPLTRRLTLTRLAVLAILAREPAGEWVEAGLRPTAAAAGTERTTIYREIGAMRSYGWVETWRAPAGTAAGKGGITYARLTPAGRAARAEYARLLLQDLICADRVAEASVLSCNGDGKGGGA